MSTAHSTRTHCYFCTLFFRQCACITDTRPHITLLQHRNATVVNLARRRQVCWAHTPPHLHASACHTRTTCRYPLSWTELGTDVFNPLQTKYTEHLRYTLPLPDHEKMQEFRAAAAAIAAVNENENTKNTSILPSNSEGSAVRVCVLILRRAMFHSATRCTYRCS